MMVRDRPPTNAPVAHDEDLTESWLSQLLRHALVFLGMAGGLVCLVVVANHLQFVIHGAIGSSSLGTFFIEYRISERAAAISVAVFLFFCLRHIGAFADITHRSIFARALSVLATRYDHLREHEMKMRLASLGGCGMAATALLLWIAGPAAWQSAYASNGSVPSTDELLTIARLSALDIAALLLLFQAADQYWVLMTSRPARQLVAPLMLNEGSFRSRSSGRALTLIHLSDLHVTDSAHQPLIGEGDRIDTCQVLDTLLSARRAELARAAVVLVTGDMTDTGGTAEWRRLLDCFRSHGLLDKVVLVPGNHDTNIPHREWGRWELPGMPGRQRRLQRAMEAFDACMGDRALVWQGHREGTVTLREYLLEKQGALLSAATRLRRRGSCLTIDAAWRAMFPLIVEFPEHSSALLILDSVEPTATIAANAFGRIGQESWVRTLEVRRHYEAKKWACWYSWHHHLAIPEQPEMARGPMLQWLVSSLFAAPSELKGRFLVLQDAAYVVSGLLNGPLKTVVFHGHRHIDRLYSVSNRIEVVSAPSSTLGDEAGKNRASLRLVTLVNDPDAGISITSAATMGLEGASGGEGRPDPESGITAAGGGDVPLVAQA